MKKLGEGNKGLNPYFAPFAKLLKNSFSPLIPFFFIPMSFLPYQYRCADQPGAGTMGKKGKRVAHHFTPLTPRIAVAAVQAAGMGPL